MNNKKIYWLWASLISMLLMIVTMSFSKLLWNGNLAYTDYDLYAQVVSFSRMFYKKLFEGSNLYYSFKAGLGMNTSLMFAFYVLSPFNILYALCDVEAINTISIIIFIMKIGVCAAMFQLFCGYNLGIRKAESIVGAVCYALMSYGVYTCRMNILYDAMYMLPIVLIVLKYSIEHSKFFVLSIVYAILFAMNFYGGYVVGISSFVYFIFYICIIYRGDVKKAKIVVCYIISVVIAFLVTSALLLPTVYEALKQNVIEDAYTFKAVWPWEQVEYFFPFNNSYRYAIAPQYYCGLMILFLTPAFFFNNTIKKKYKFIAGGILGIFSLSLLVKPLYLAAHMFNNPTGYTCRFVYVVAFFVICLALIGIRNRAGINCKKVLITDIVFVALYLVTPVLNKLFINDRFEIDVTKSILTLVLSAIWLFLVRFFLNGKVIKDEEGNSVLSLQSVMILMVFLLGLEIGIQNYSLFNTQAYHDKTFFTQYINETDALVNGVTDADDDIYRIHNNFSMHHNQGALYNYMGSTLFSSSSNKDLKQFLRGLGIYCSEFVISDYGDNDLVRLLVDEKYILNDKRLVTDENIYSVVRNDNVAGIGYWTPDSIKEYVKGTNVFENHNMVYTSIGNETTSPFEIYDGQIEFQTDNVVVDVTEQGVFMERGLDRADGYVILKVPYVQGKEAYAWLDAGYNTSSEQSPMILSDNDEIISGYMESYLSAPHMVQMSEEDGYFCLYIYFTPTSINRINLLQCQIAYYDSSVVGKLAGQLREHQLDIDVFEDGFISGHMTCEEDGIVFVSVPYEDGWEATVDGNIVNIVPVLQNSFIGIPVEAGEHEVVLRFNAPYSNIGCIGSLVGILMLILLLVYEAFMKRRLQNKI